MSSTPSKDFIEQLQNPICSKKLCTGVILRGTVPAELRSKLKSKIKHDSQVALESMQIEQKQRDQTLMNLFVVKPKQTGFTAVAELTASALNNPATTALLVIPQGEENADNEAQLDLDKLTDFIKSTGAPVFIDPTEAANHVNGLVDKSEDDFVWIDPEDTNYN